MRKFLLPLMLAGVAMPVPALAEDGGVLRGLRAQAERSAERERSSEARPQREERVRVSRERPQRAERSDNVPRMERSRRDGGVMGAILDSAGEQQAERRTEGHRDGTRRDGFEGLRDRIVEHGDRVDRNREWSRDWRRDHRYDWSRYRYHHGSLYRLGRYYDPYGWGYRRFSIGFSMWPSYYGSSYWLNDPFHYRLPPAYGPYRWIRYYDDALLVNIYSGRVVDVIHNFFW